MFGETTKLLFALSRGRCSARQLRADRETPAGSLIEEEESFPLACFVRSQSVVFVVPSFDRYALNRNKLPAVMLALTQISSCSFNSS